MFITGGYLNSCSSKGFEKLIIVVKIGQSKQRKPKMAEMGEGGCLQVLPASLTNLSQIFANPTSGIYLSVPLYLFLLGERVHRSIQ
jgi:hypothetical protein